MKILLLGGTGAIGIPLVEILSTDNHQVFVTTRKKREDYDCVKYIQGNAKDITWLESSVLNEKYDAIVDFMHYSETEFKSRKDVLLKSTKHYFLLSSARVFAPSSNAITEESPRLLDVVKDAKYLSSDEYALSKARCEDLLKVSTYDNWTIIRPYITYNSNRLQLCLYEKELWINRALKGKKIVFSKELNKKITTLTSAKDVASVIAKLIIRNLGFREIYNVTGEENLTWGDVVKIYLKAIKNITGKVVNVTYMENSYELSKVIGNSYKYKYDRNSNRIFDNSKIKKDLPDIIFTRIEDGLYSSTVQYLHSSETIKLLNPKVEAYLDRISKDKSRRSDFYKNAFLKYVLFRYTFLLKHSTSKNDIGW